MHHNSNCEKVTTIHIFPYDVLDFLNNFRNYFMCNGKCEYSCYSTKKENINVLFVKQENPGRGGGGGRKTLMMPSNKGLRKKLFLA